MSGRLQDKVAIVMGAGCIGEGWGNGKATAVLFAREGASVVCVDRDEKAAQATAAIIDEEGGNAFAIRADVTSTADIDQVARATLERYGRIDILQNNVGIGETGPTETMSDESWQRLIDINLTGMFNSCRRIMPEIAAGGAVVNISSVASIRIIGVPMVGYYATKGAVNQMTQALAIEYAKRGVRCNAVLPGLMHTPMIVEPYRDVYDNIDDMIAQRNAMCPTGSMGDAWDVAHASLFLASSEAKYITGALLPVDGGISCKVG